MIRPEVPRPPLSPERRAELRTICIGIDVAHLPPKTVVYIRPDEIVSLIDEIEQLHGMFSVSAELTIKALDHG